MFDLHVHAAPDVRSRLLEDTRLADAYSSAGATGFVLKAHYESTAGRAAACRRRGLSVYGGVVLNNAVGGFNPQAAAAVLRSGGRVIWMPTEDARAHRQARLGSFADSDPRLQAPLLAAPPLEATHERAIRLILSMAAEADAVIATGHLSAREVRWLVGEAGTLGVRRILLTHPGYTVPAMDARDAARFAALGAHVEITAYQLLHQPGCTVARLAAYVRAVGYDRLVLTSDAGQPDSPPGPEALALLVDSLAGAGLDRGALEACASEVPWRLVSP